MIYHIHRWFTVDIRRQFALYFITLAIGTGLAIILRVDKVWLQWSFSALGEGWTISAIVFNSTLLLTTGLLWHVSDNLADRLHLLHNYDSERATRWFMRAICACLVAVALFPNDTHHAPHVTAGRALVVLFALYALILPLTVARISRMGRAATYLMPVMAIALSLHGYVHHRMPFVAYESLMATMIIVWFMAYSAILQKDVDRLR